MRHKVAGLIAIFLLASLATISTWQVGASRALEADRQSLLRRLPALKHPNPAAPCKASSSKAEALRLLILGQSNAANHGEPAAQPNPLPLELWAVDACVQARDPLPGGSGSGASIWSQLPAVMQAHTPSLSLSFAVIAVDATSIADWTDSDGPLVRHLGRRLAKLDEAGWRPDLVLWQQGEADMQKGTTRAAYKQGFERLRQYLRQQGVQAPMLLAHSTFCAGHGSEAVRSAIDELVLQYADLLPGPDTDQLSASQSRHGPCHFSQQGLAQAATLWASAIDDARQTLNRGAPTMASQIQLKPIFKIQP